MKKIYIFGFFTRIFMIASILFAIYLGIDNCLFNGINFQNISLITILSIFLLLVIYWQWTLGIFINKKRNTLIFSFYLNKSKNVERLINTIQSIKLEKKRNLGFNFIVNFKDGYKEEIFYSFYRVSFIEEIQIKRIKRKLTKLNEMFKNTSGIV